MSPRLAITGATGYIGSALAQAALAAGWKVRALTRTQPSDARLEFVPYSLDAALPPEALAAVDAVVHLAADTKAGSAPSIAREQEAARRLFAAASSPTRVIFVSSQAARADAPSDYGRAKWRIEQDALAAGALVVRPGLVYGGSERALFGALCHLVRKLPILPDLLPRPQVQPIHVDDLAHALLRLLEDPQASGCYNLGSAETVSFTPFLSAIATHRIARPRLFIPVPIAALITAMRLAGTILGRGGHPQPPVTPGLDPRVHTANDADRLRSLRDLPPMATRDDLARLGLRLRPLETGMARSSRRPLTAEARAMLHYILRRPPSAGLVKRYVQAVAALQDAAPLPLPPLCRRFPAAIVLLDHKQAVDRLATRLEIATLLAESTPQGAERFLGSRAGRFGALATAVGAVAAEVLLRLARLPLTPWLARTRLRIAQAAQ